MSEDWLKRIKLVLASASPRRRSILAEMGVRFDVDPPTQPEPDPADFPSVELFATHAAHRKAVEVADRRSPDEWILAADTVVEVGGTVLGKPLDRADAKRILQLLVGRRHRTWTGLCLLRCRDRMALLYAEASWVTFRKIGDDRLEDYLDSGAWKGKAGAYGIQDRDDPFVESLEGSFTNVVGLPMEGLGRLLLAVEPMNGVAR
jgi:septum formation protein